MEAVHSNLTMPSTPLVRGKVAYEFAAVQGDAMTGAAADLSAVERVGIKRAVDTVSDRHLRDARRLGVQIQNLFRLIRTDPANAIAHATHGEAEADRQLAALDEGIRLDDIEDEHDELILADVQASAAADRRIVQRAEQALTGRAVELLGATP